jgi:hypothetical protein
MNGVALAPGTERAGLEETTMALQYWLHDRPTGWEYGGEWAIVDVLVEVGWAQADPAAAPDPEASAGISGRAAALAADASYVESPPPPAPRLNGNLAEDVHAVCGLTWAQIADVFQISERAAAGWRTQGVPRPRVQTMEALRTIGTTLVGGLGAEGVCEWLSAGRPSRLQRIRKGQQQAVAGEALDYRDTPAT